MATKEIFKTITFHNREYVIKESERVQGFSVNKKGERELTIPLPNFKNTGYCLCGVLKKGQSLNDFIAEYKLKKATSKPRRA